MRRAFLLWAVVSTAWLANSVRTRGVEPETLLSSPALTVTNRATTLDFVPTSLDRSTAVIFICGSGVAAAAYAPLLRPIAEAGYPVFVVKLPWRFAPLESHKQAAVDRVQSVIATYPDVQRWVLAGHSLGGALASRVARNAPPAIAAMVLIGTTHPKEDDLSDLRIPVTKVYGSHDGVAPAERVRANQRLLPAHTQWIEIPGGNHSQFGHYGHQLFDRAATISRVAQQEITRAAILEVIAQVQPR